MKTPAKVKYELLINNVVTDVTEDVTKWEELETDYSRDDVKSVYVNISAPVNFIGAAYNVIRDLYEKDSFNAVCTLIISIRNDALTDVRALWNYIEKFRADLDFSTYTQNETFIKINLKESGLAAKIKANKGTVYDIPISELTPKTLNYDRLSGINRIGFKPAPNKGDLFSFPSDKRGASVTMGLDFTELMHDEMVTVFDDKGESTQVQKVRLSDVGAIRIDGYSPTYLSAEFKVNYIEHGGIYTGVNIIVKFFFVAQNGERTLISQSDNNGYVKVDNVNISSEQGWVIMTMDVSAWGNPVFEFSITEFKKLEVSYLTRASSVDIDLVSIESLLSNLITKIAGVGYTASVNLGITNTVRLAAAESIRGLPNARIHTSFDKLYKSLRAVFGLEYDIEGNTISFKTRDSLFENIEAIKVDDVTDVILSVNSEHIYSNIEVGFKKIDYQKANGKDEFRFTNQFTTGVINSNKKLELISEYRADAWGIEFLSQKRGEKTTDNESDDDVFFIDVVQVDNKFILNRASVFSGNLISPSTMFNAIFSPKQCLLRNKKYLGVSTRLLTFASAEGNSDVSINGIKETDNVSIELTERLFSPDKIEMKVGKIVDVPTQKNGYVSFVHRGKIYAGFIDNLKHNYGRNKQTTWTLFRKS